MPTSTNGGGAPDGYKINATVILVYPLEKKVWCNTNLLLLTAQWAKNNEVITYSEIPRIKFHFYLLRMSPHNCLITTAINQLYTDYVLLGRST